MVFIAFRSVDSTLQDSDESDSPPINLATWSENMKRFTGLPNPVAILYAPAGI